MAKNKQLPQQEHEWEQCDENDLKEFLKQISKNGDALKVERLKEMSVYANKIVKTQIKVHDFVAGDNREKGWEVRCPECKLQKTIYNPWLKFCKDAFAKEKKDAGVHGCFEYGPKGAKKQIEIERKQLNDTGLFCLCSDAKDAGVSKSDFNVFFSNTILPKNETERDLFELEMQKEIVEIVGIIRPLGTDKKSRSTDWMIDVQSFKIIKKKYETDFDLAKSMNGIKRDDDFFGKYFAPEIVGRSLNKKIMAITLCNPLLKLKMPNGLEILSNIRIVDAGDPGQAKTKSSNKMICEYCKDTNVQIIAVENSTARGLLIKNISKAGRWHAVLGAIPKMNGQIAILDGFGKMSQDDLAQYRGIEEEGILQCHKAGGSVKTEVLLHSIKLANLKNYIKEYSSKHQASFDISATTSDISRKFDGADRRRQDHFVICGDDDTNAREIAQHKFKSKRENFEHIKFWNNMRRIAWSRKAEDFVFEDDVIDYVLEIIGNFGERYKSFSLDYGILSKAGADIFLKQLPGVALLHGSIDNNGIVTIKKEHAEWLKEVYEQEFLDLGLECDLERDEYLTKHAKAILANCGEEKLKILGWHAKHGTLTAIENKKISSRPTMLARLRELVRYSIADQDGLENNFVYSFQDGSGHEIASGYKTEFVHDFEIEKWIKKDGSLTPFGKIIMREFKNGKK